MCTTGACSQPRLTARRRTSSPEGIASVSCGVEHSLKWSSWKACPLTSRLRLGVVSSEARQLAREPLGHIEVPLMDHVLSMLRTASRGQEREAVSPRISCAPPQTYDAPNARRSPHNAHPAGLARPLGASAQLPAPLPTHWQGPPPMHAEEHANLVCRAPLTVPKTGSAAICRVSPHDVGNCLRKGPLVNAALIFCRVSLGVPLRT